MQTYLIEGNVDSATVKEIRALCDYDGPLTVNINSYGGNIMDGYAIYNLLTAHKHDVITVNMGVAAGIAAVIYLAGNARIARKDSSMMFTRSTTMAHGNVSDLKQVVETLQELDDSLESILKQHTDQYERLFTFNDAWVNADEAQAMGLIDKVVE